MKHCSGKGLRGIFLLAALLGGTPLCAQQGGNLANEIRAKENVVSVQVLSEDGKVLLANPSGLAVRLGEPLDLAEVSASLRTLYQSGDYADLRAVLKDAPGGVALDFIAKENLFINQVLIQGLQPPPTETSAVAAMHLSLGQTYSKQEIADALDRLRD